MNTRRKIIDEIPEVQEQDLPYHVKYRPTKLDEVLGQKEVVASLKALLKKPTHPHSFLFTGPSGTGKTTLARILASAFGVLPHNITETDAATNTGIDSMRAITETLRYMGHGDNPNKIIIIDECHALSKAAWQSLLKPVEEPPAHIYFAFCTTDDGKIPETIKTRGPKYNLNPLKYDDLMDLLEMVANQERLRTSDAILKLVAQSCEGSPRQALVMLAMVQECDSVDEAATLLAEPLDNKEVIDLARLLLDRSLTWSKVQSTIASIPEQSPESIRIVITTYISACLLKAKGDRDVPRMLDILNAFSSPCNPTDKMAPILLAFGNLLYPS